MQRPSIRSYWKIPLLNRGKSPVKSEDPEVDVLIERCVKEKKNLVATYTYEVMKLADVVVVGLLSVVVLEVESSRCFDCGDSFVGRLNGRYSGAAIWNERRSVVERGLFMKKKVICSVYLG